MFSNQLQVNIDFKDVKIGLVWQTTVKNRNECHLSATQQMLK
jgi:hypothetical protein